MCGAMTNQTPRSYRVPKGGGRGTPGHVPCPPSASGAGGVPRPARCPLCAGLRSALALSPDLCMDLTPGAKKACERQRVTVSRADGRAAAR